MFLIYVLDIIDDVFYFFCCVPCKSSKLTKGITEKIDDMAAILESSGLFEQSKNFRMVSSLSCNCDEIIQPLSHVGKYMVEEYRLKILK